MADTKPKNIPIDHKPITGPWVLYELADGSKIRLRHAVTQFWRVPGQYTVDGHPSYAVDCQLIMDVTGAPDLMQGAEPRKLSS